jgi:hypothetical protein
VIQLSISEIVTELQKVAAGEVSAYRMFDLARSIEYAQLELEKFGDADIEVYRYAFGCNPTAPISGLEHFVGAIFSDFEKLDQKQASMLLDLFVSNLEKYTPLAAQALADLVARKYPLYVSIDAFERGFITRGDRAMEFADFGAQVLSLTLPKQGVERDALRRLGAVMQGL